MTAEYSDDDDFAATIGPGGGGVGGGIDGFSVGGGGGGSGEDDPLEALTDDDEREDTTLLGPALDGTLGDVENIARFHAGRRDAAAAAAAAAAAVGDGFSDSGGSDDYDGEGGNEGGDAAFFDDGEGEDDLAASRAASRAAAGGAYGAYGAYDEGATLVPEDAMMMPSSSAPPSSASRRGDAAAAAAAAAFAPRASYFHDSEEMMAQFDALLEETGALKQEKAKLLHRGTSLAQQLADTHGEIRRLSARSALATVEPGIGGGGGGGGGGPSNSALNRGRKGGSGGGGKDGGGGGSAPPSAHEQRVAARTLELQLLHAELTRELARYGTQIKHARQDAVGLRRRGKALGAAAAELPRDSAVTLVQARLQLLRLLDGKAALQVAAAERHGAAAREQRVRQRANAALQAELDAASAALQDAREGARQWRARHAAEALQLQQLGAEERELRAELQAAAGVRAVLELEFERFATQGGEEGAPWVLQPADVGRALAGLVAGEEAAMEDQVCAHLARHKSLDGGLSFEDFYLLFMDSIVGEGRR